MKTKEEVYEAIKNDFLTRSKIDIQEGTAMDFYNLSVSDGIEKAYETIEANRNPHIFTRLTGQELDSNGWFLNMPRRTGEDDATYLYRQMNWVADKQRSNQASIENALLTLTHASDARFIPRTNGSGTGTVYLIPTEYTEAQKALAITEAQTRLRETISPTAHIDFVIPRELNVKLVVYMDPGTADTEPLKDTLTEKIRDYVNAIAPRQAMELGAINRIGINEPGIQYFNVVQCFVDNDIITGISIEQQIHTKLFLDEIIWTIEGM